LLYNKLREKYDGIKNVIVDASYKIPTIAKMIIDDGKTPIMPYDGLTPLLSRLFVSIFEVLEEIYNEIVMAS